MQGVPVPLVGLPSGRLPEVNTSNCNAKGVSALQGDAGSIGSRVDESMRPCAETICQERKEELGLIRVPGLETFAGGEIISTPSFCVSKQNLWMMHAVEAPGCVGSGAYHSRLTTSALSTLLVLYWKTKLTFKAQAPSLEPPVGWPTE